MLLRFEIERFKCDLGRKSKSNFALFDPLPVKIREGVDEMSEQVFDAGSSWKLFTSGGQQGDRVQSVTVAC